MSIKIHPTADVKTISIGEGTLIWQFCIILENAKIGKGCNINAHTFIENDVIIGDNVTVKCGVYLWDGIRVENNVFIGPNVTFVNDRYPRSQQYPETYCKTLIKEGASIGANTTILDQIEIGCFSMVGAGSVVTKNIPDYAIVIGNPAKIAGWVNKEGQKLILQKNGIWKDSVSKVKYVINNDQLVKL